MSLTFYRSADIPLQRIPAAQVFGHVFLSKISWRSLKYFFCLKSSAMIIITNFGGIQGKLKFIGVQQMPTGVAGESVLNFHYHRFPEQSPSASFVDYSLGKMVLRNQMFFYGVVSIHFYIVL